MCFGKNKKNMVTVYYAGNTKPEKRTCEKFGYPNYDSKGEQQYVNTHFLKIEDAWGRVFAEAIAGVSIDTVDVKELKRRLLEAKKRLRNSVIEYAEVESNFEAFKNGELTI